MGMGMQTIPKKGNVPVDIFGNPRIPHSLYIESMNLYNGVVHKYVPRILSALSKYNFYQYLLVNLGINYKFLLMFMVVIF
jgi:hypothetical protein